MAYVNNTTLLEALLASHAAGTVTQECYEQFEHICRQRIRVLLKYDVQQHQEPMLVKCMDKCLKIWPNFKFNRDNAFAYFVSVIDNTIKLYYMQNDAKLISIDEQEEMYSEKD